MTSRAAALALAGALLLSTAGCAFVTQAETQQPYDASDGVNATVGQVKIGNALAITNDGKTLALNFTATNNGDSDVQLSVNWQSDGSQVTRDFTIPGLQARVIGRDDPQVQITGVDARPGSLFPIYFQYGSVQGRELDVPVLDGSLPEYSTLTPTATPTPTPTATISPVTPSNSAIPSPTTPTATPTPTPTPTR